NEEEREHDDHAQPHQQDDLVHTEEVASEDDRPLDRMADRREVDRKVHLGFTPGKARDAPTYFVSQKRRPSCVTRIVMARTERLIQAVWRTASTTAVTSAIRARKPPSAIAMRATGDVRAAHDSERAASRKLATTTA